MTDKNNNKKEDNKYKNSYVGYGVAFGLLGGAALSTIIGIFLETSLIWAFGPGLGMLVGIVIAVIMDSNKNKE